MKKRYTAKWPMFEVEPEQEYRDKVRDLFSYLSKYEGLNEWVHTSLGKYRTRTYPNYIWDMVADYFTA